MEKINVMLLTVLIVSSRVYSEKTKLYVGALLELSNHWYQKYVNFFVHIIKHVFEEVENRTDILEDYSLQLITKDTQGNSGLAARQLFALMTEGPPIVAVLGPTLSKELTVVGQITPFYNVIQISYIAQTSSTLSQELFPTLFMVNQIMDDLNPLRIKMMQYFNWNRVGTIFFQNDIYVSHMNMFHDLLKQYNMTLLTSAVASIEKPDIKVLISRLVHYDVRIIMGTFAGSDSPAVFCEAYHQGLYGSKYVWILNGPVFNINRDFGDFTQYGCTYQQFVEVVNGIFTLNYDEIDAKNPVTISQQTPVQLANLFEEMASRTNYKLSSYYGWVYDAAWSLAAGLNNSLSYLNASGLVGYKNDPDYLDAVMKGMHEVNFAGISGPVSFDAIGRRAGVTYIEQYSNMTKSRVAIYNHKTGNLTWFVHPNTLWKAEMLLMIIYTTGIQNSLKCFASENLKNKCIVSISGEEIPQDRFTYFSVMVSPNIPSLVLVLTANIACLVVALGFLTFNIYYRRNSNIKLSSPMINNIIIGGSLLMFVCVLLTAFDYGHILPQSHTDNICMVRVWIMCLGFTCLFGALFSKTWRVHILFRNNQLKKKVIKDRHLFGIVLFLLLFDCIILVPWTVTHALQKDKIVQKTKDLYNQNNIIAEVYTYCHHKYEGYWFVSVYIYKGLLLAFGTFLAWETRHVTVPALNDSKYIGFCIYNVVIVCIFGVPLTHVLPTEQITLTFILLSTLVMFCTTMCLCILFIPKIKIRHQVGGKFLNPELNVKTGSGSASEQKQSTSTDRANDFDVARNKELKRMDYLAVEQMKDEISRRTMKVEAETIAIARLNRLLNEAVGEDSASGNTTSRLSSSHRHLNQVNEHTA